MQQEPQNVVEAEVVDEDTLRLEREKREEQLQAFGTSMAHQRDDWIRSRYSYGVDKRWIEDEDQYNAKDNIAKQASQMMTSVEQGYPVTTQMAKPHRSTVYIGLTRQKTNAAEARLADILLPTDDRNWGIQPTPIPTLMSMGRDERMAGDKDTGQPMMHPETQQPLRMKDIARASMQVARDKAKAMQTEIDDQLTECDYNGEMRKVIHNAARLGTGVIKGPIVTNRTRKAWQPFKDMEGNVIHQLEIVQEMSPASFSIDPRNVWPDPGCGDNIHHGKGMYEREQLTVRQVRELAKQPGYMKDQLRKVLEEGPKKSATFQELKDDDQRDIARDVYEKWEYWGEVDYDDLKSAGLKLDAEKDELKSISACVVMINNTVVKVYINPLEDGALPYDFFVWEKVADSVWGYGIPYLMRAQQKVLNAAWRQMMDNAGVSSGPQIIVKAGAIQPADKQWQLSARKIWFATDDVDDVRKAFTAVEFNSYQAELAAIIKMAMELADQETGVPAITQGEKGAAPDTVGGMQMLMNSANVVLRRLVKQFDDSITRPHIRRYYDFNMMYNEDEEVKGDFTIDARGSSALLVRDIQNQAFLNLLAAGANPVYGVYLDTQKLFEKALQAQHIDPAEVLKSEDELEKIKEQQAQPQQGQPDPALEVAKLRGDIELQKAQVQNQGDMAELQLRQQIAQQEHDLRMAELQMTREIEMLKMSNQQNISLETIKAKLAETAIKERGKKELYAAEQNLKMTMGSGI
ncbi:hypothetical protein UFOVP123_11 [uncultured Caudovirales phage]|uniref:Uncharacterized protein n=1 Tax=uncultured Caudovirales phage TaxID=2100421 RepID=A0A6J5L7G7_9CAUD|nr:hypothetical protein UFOVP123_11 [uncultured Caudovirales phage]